MELRMIRCGMLAGFAFLITVAVLEVWAAGAGGASSSTAAGEGDIADQVWQVLAEARRITEGAA